MRSARRRVERRLQRRLGLGKMPPTQAHVPVVEPVAERRERAIVVRTVVQRRARIRPERALPVDDRRRRRRLRLSSSNVLTRKFTPNRPSTRSIPMSDRSTCQFAERSTPLSNAPPALMYDTFDAVAPPVDGIADDAPARLVVDVASGCSPGSSRLDTRPTRARPRSCPSISISYQSIVPENPSRSGSPVLGCQTKPAVRSSRPPG